MADRCCTHDASDPCPYCAWAASGDSVKVRAAANRAARVAGTPVIAAADSGYSGERSGYKAACPARYKLVPD